MEKFGLFELLDALSALTQRGGDAQQPFPPAENAAPQTPPAENQTKTDAPPSDSGDAVSSFLARHDAIAQKVKDRKRNK